MKTASLEGSFMVRRGRGEGFRLVTTSGCVLRLRLCAVVHMTQGINLDRCTIPVKILSAMKKGNTTVISLDYET